MGYNLKKLFKALVPNGAFYPQGGDVFEAVKDVQIRYTTYFMAPYTGGEKAWLLKGEKVIVERPARSMPSGYSCYPVNEVEVENRIIPVDDKDDPAYNGFGLYIDTTSLKANFKPVKLKPFRFVKGDATMPIGEGIKIIVHICNDIGGWGKGFVMAISRRWKQPEIEYRNWYKKQEAEQTDTIRFERLASRDRYSNEKKFELGNVQFVQVTDDTWVANMIAQRDIRPNDDGVPPIRYVYVSECLQRVREFAKRKNATVHMPRIGCGLAGGEWPEIEYIIKFELIAHDIEATVYDFE